MPGLIYFYINFWKIQINLSNTAKQKVIGDPFLRDLEWDKGYVFTEARGFSGFQDDDVYTCHRILEKNTETEEVIKVLYPKSNPDYQEIYNSKGELKKFEPARTYLRKNHGKDLGKPLYKNQARNVVDCEARGCLAEDTEVLMYDGTTKKAQDILVGDQLMGKDSTPRTVEWLHSGISDMYKIISTKYKELIVNENHELSVKYISYNRKGNKEIQKSFNIKDLLEKQKQNSFTDRYYRYIPKEGINYSIKELPIDPYYLGLWLSDGRSNCTSIKLTDSKIWEYLENFSKQNNFITKCTILESSENRKEAKEYYIKNDIFRGHFKNYNLLNNKYIPQDYITSSKEQRIKLLEGFIDGDGCYDTKHHSYDIYCGLSEIIADKVVLIARSLGLYSNKTIRDRKGYKRTYEVIISGNIEILNPLIERKKPKVFKRRIDPTRSSFKIEYYKKDKFYGFHVDKDNEYLLSDYTVDHNSGKSFYATAMAAYNFLFDGALDYDDYLLQQSLGSAYSSETMIGAIDSKYSNDLISKFKIGLDNLKGAQERGGKYYPSPFYKKFEGSLMCGKFITAKHKVKRGANWDTKGSNSKLYHRSFADNPEAGNGTRSNIILLEEVGFMGNLEEALGSLKDTTYNGMNKTGTIWMFGCVCAGTKVWDHSGKQINIEDLKQEDGIIGYEGRGVSKEPIVWIQPPKQKPCYRITTEGGEYIECSEDHPLLWSKNKWGNKNVTFKRADEVKIGDQLMQVNQVPIFGTASAVEPRLLGLLIGDGYYGGRSVELSIEGEDIFNWLQTKGYRLSVSKTFTTKTGSTYRRVVINAVQPVLKAMGIMGQKKEFKHLPTNISQYDMYSISEILGGYFDADGSVGDQRITLKSKYKHLLEEVKIELFKFGIDCYILKEYRKEGYKPGEVYVLYVRKRKSIEQFQKHIHFIDSRKQEKLMSLLTSNPKLYYDNCTFVKSESTEKGSYYLQHNGLNALNSKCVISVEFLGMKDVYNLNAGLTHTYITNKFISGNTGGQMEAGATEALKRIFYDPEGYDCLSFEDTWENTGKIGYFVPYIYALNEYKDSEGNTDIARVTKDIDAKREILKKAKSKEPLRKEMQNNPLKPSEAFLIVDGNIFPTTELKEHLNYLESITDNSVDGDWGELTIGSDGRVKWLPDLDNKFRPSDYPVKKGEATAGCIVIWEHPEYIDGAIPYGLYIAGNDPYDQDNAKNSESLGSTFIYKSFMASDGIHDVIVAEYTGRPATAKEHHETVRRLLLYYNAVCLYENEKNTIKMHFEHNNSLYLLANTPGILKANQGSSLNRTYGQHMTDHVKDELEIYTRDWLSEARGEGKLNLHTIKSKPLLKELISYSRNKELNYDRVIAFMLVILLKLQNHRIKIESLKEGPKVDPFFERTWKLAQKRNKDI